MQIHKKKKCVAEATVLVVIHETISNFYPLIYSMLIA